MPDKKLSLAGVNQSKQEFQLCFNDAIGVINASGLKFQEMQRGKRGKQLYYKIIYEEKKTLQHIYNKKIS